jgi:hypothetical protein
LTKVLLAAAAAIIVIAGGFYVLSEKPNEPIVVAATLPGVVEQMKNFDNCAFHLNLARTEAALYEKGKNRNNLDAALFDFMTAYHRANQAPTCAQDKIRGEIATFFRTNSAAMNLANVRDSDVDTMIAKFAPLHATVSRSLVQAIALYDDFAKTDDRTDPTKRRLGESARRYLETVFEAGVGKREVKNPQTGVRTILSSENYATILDGLRTFGILRVDDRSQEGSILPYWQINSLDQAKFFSESPRFVAGLSYLSAVE